MQMSGTARWNQCKTTRIRVADAESKENHLVLAQVPYDTLMSTII